MGEQTVTIIIAIISAIGGGGLGAAIVGWLASRKKVAADVASTLMTVAEKRLLAYEARTATLETKVNTLECEIANQREERQARENVIETLQKEIKRLEAESKHKDKVIEALTERVRELEKRINQLSKGDDG